MSSNEFGKYLKDARKNKGMTLESLGDRIGLSKSYLSHIENGRREPPSPDILRKIAETLETSYEGLMIKAGFWDERYSTEDKQRFEEIHNSRWESIVRISEILKALADDDGYFPDYMHKEIFEIFSGHLVLDEGNMTSHSFDEFYKYDYLEKSDPEDYFGKQGLREIRERFNLIYNYTTIKNALPNYRGEKEFLDDLIALADKHGVIIGEEKSNFKNIDLSEILQDQSIIVRFNNKLISQKIRYELIGYLEAKISVDEIIMDDSK